MKRLIAFALLLIISVATALGLSQDIGSSWDPINLDLPYNGGGSTTEEEDAAEIIFFYGEQLEGDVFVFCVDRSASMARQGALACAKREICRAIKELSPQSEFAVCFFDTDVLMWPPNGSPVGANPETREEACAWVASIGKGGQSCPQTALLRSLKVINRSQKSHRCILYVGDGGGTCFKSGWDKKCPPGIATKPGKGYEWWYLTETLNEVDEYNLKDVEVNTIGVMMGARFGSHHYFVRKLAERNDGICRLIN